MRWRSLPQPSQCLSASARSCTIRSRTRFFARGCRPVRFLTGVSGGFSSPPVSAAAGSSLASSGCRAFQSSSNSVSCSFESCSLLRLRCASSSSRSRLRYLSFSALSCWSCSHRSTTIFCNTSTSFGSVLGSMGGTCLQNNPDLLRFQAKSNYDQNVLCVCAPIPLAPRSVAQIDAAQQRSEFFHADLKTPRARLSAGNRVGTRFQTFRPDGKPIPVPVQNLEPISALVGEQVKMAGKWIQLEMIPHEVRAARRSSGACRRDSGTNTLVYWLEGESSPYDVQHQAKRRRVHTVPDPELIAIGQNQFQWRRAGHRFQKSELHRCALL